MKKLFLLVAFLVTISSLPAQSSEEKEKALKLSQEAIDEMDKGEIENALLKFTQASILDSGNINYKYEIAHCYFLTRNYKKSIAHLEPLLNHPNVSDRVYNLLGNSYEFNKNESKALEVYNKGLEKFPSSGSIYHSLGNLSMKKGKYQDALVHFEKGIEAEPTFSNNYYWASKVHSSLEDKLWGIIFAELYINMEGVGEQSEELSKMIMDVLQKGIRKEGTQWIVDIADADTTGKNFEHEVESQMLVSVKNIDKPVSASSLADIRKDFINSWVESGKADKFPNLLLDWHKQLLLKGYLEVYHQWLFKATNPEEFQKYVAANGKMYEEFTDWLSQNYLKPEKSRYFVPAQYSN